MPDTISGTVAYLERMAMPPSAEVRVALLDGASGNAPARVIAEVTEVMGERQVPIPFAIEIPAGAIDEQTPYALHAEILIDGALQFQTPDPIPVPTLGAPLDGIEIRVSRST